MRIDRDRARIEHPNGSGTAMRLKLDGECWLIEVPVFTGR